MLRKSLIKAELTDNVEDTTNLVTQLTFLPLAIVQAAAYINKNDIKLSRYPSLLGKQDVAAVDRLSEQFEDDHIYSNVKNPVATTWLISFKQILHQDPKGEDFTCIITSHTLNIARKPAAASVSLPPNNLMYHPNRAILDRLHRVSRKLLGASNQSNCEKYYKDNSNNDQHGPPKQEPRWDSPSTPLKREDSTPLLFEQGHRATLVYILKVRRAINALHPLDGEVLENYQYILHVKERPLVDWPTTYSVHLAFLMYGLASKYPHLLLSDFPASTRYLRPSHVRPYSLDPCLPICLN
jgi:hypothetical protein